MGPSIIMEKGFLEIDREKELLVILVKELKDGGGVDLPDKVT